MTGPDPSPDEADPPTLQIDGDPQMRGGIWANFATVAHSPYEFTLDFIRLDYNTRGPIEGVVVQRVNMSTLFVKQPIDALTANLEDYGRTMPDGVGTEEDQ